MTRIAHLGCGYWGRNLARNLSEMGLLAALGDNNMSAAADMAKTLGTKALDVEDIFADPSIDGVTIATPAKTHKDIAIQALAAGKHVFVEKPLTLSEVDSLELIEAAKKADRQLMVGHLLRYHPIFCELLGLVGQGKIGTLQYVYSNRMSFGKFRAEEDVLWSFAPHDLSMILTLVGEEPTHVSVQGADIFTPDIADWATMQMKFQNNIRAHVQVSWLHPFKEQRIVAIGDDGMLVFEDSQPEWDKKLAFYPHTVDVSGPVPVPQKKDAEFIAVKHAEPLKEEMRHFADCIANDCVPLTDGIEGLMVQRTLTRAGEKLNIYSGDA